MRRKKRIKISEERRSDERSLYYILERDLDRDAIFPNHDGWYSQVSFGKGSTIDYVLRYGHRIYGIEVKTGIPRIKHFEQAKKYCTAVDGIFLAHPSDRVGEARYLAEKAKQHLDVGLISLTLFRSHIIRKAIRNNRQMREIWENRFDEQKYWREVKNWSWERSDGLPKTALEDGCFWTSFNTKGKYNEEKKYRLPFNKSSWYALGVLYAANTTTSLDRYFSHKSLWELCKEMGWKSFSPWALVRCDLADVRTYGDLMWVYSLSYKAHYLFESVRKALKKKLGKKEWQRLLKMMEELKQRHLEEQARCEKEFVTEALET